MYAILKDGEGWQVWRMYAGNTWRPVKRFKTQAGAEKYAREHGQLVRE